MTKAETIAMATTYGDLHEQEKGIKKEMLRLRSKLIKAIPVDEYVAGVRHDSVLILDKDVAGSVLRKAGVRELKYTKTVVDAKKVEAVLVNRPELREEMDYDEQHRLVVSSAWTQRRSRRSS